jgi:hypothetical protein
MQRVLISGIRAKRRRHSFCSFAGVVKNSARPFQGTSLPIALPDSASNVFAIGKTY